MSDLVKFNFHGNDLDVVKRGGDVWVSVIRVCEALGIASKPQLTKLHGKAWASGTIIVPQAENKLSRETFFLHLDALPMWLATIDAAKVAKAARPKVEDFQIHCAKVLRDHFFGTTPSGAPATLDLSVAHGVQVGDTFLERTDMRAWLTAAAKAQGVSLPRMHGVIRRIYKVASVYHLALSAWPFAKDTLQAIMFGRLMLPGKPAKLRLLANPKQAPLPGVS